MHTGPQPRPRSLLVVPASFHVTPIFGPRILARLRSLPVVCHVYASACSLIPHREYLLSPSRLPDCAALQVACRGCPLVQGSPEYNSTADKKERLNNHHTAPAATQVLTTPYEAARAAINEGTGKFSSTTGPVPITPTNRIQELDNKIIEFHLYFVPS